MGIDEAPDGDACRHPCAEGHVAVQERSVEQAASHRVPHESEHLPVTHQRSYRDVVMSRLGLGEHIYAAKRKPLWETEGGLSVGRELELGEVGQRDRCCALQRHREKVIRDGSPGLAYYSP